MRVDLPAASKTADVGWEGDFVILERSCKE
jgi:hypothetical protein